MYHLHHHVIYQIMFQKLGGFIDATHHTNDSNNGGSRFLGACAEYCPVNELLTDEATVPESSDGDRVSVNVTYAKKKPQTVKGL